MIWNIALSVALLFVFLYQVYLHFSCFKFSKYLHQYIDYRCRTLNGRILTNDNVYKVFK